MLRFCYTNLYKARRQCLKANHNTVFSISEGKKSLQVDEQEIQHKSNEESEMALSLSSTILIPLSGRSFFE